MSSLNNRSLISSLISFFFILWILPLGTFIESSKSEEFCNGQRAICLCPHLLMLQEQNANAKNLFELPPTTTSKRAPSSNPEYVLIDQVSLMVDLTAVFYDQNEIFNLKHFIKPIEHVPKVLI